MDDTAKKILSELEMLRKLKMIELLDRGYSQSKLASALGISQPTISRMMSTKKASKTTKRDGDE